jgi:hypothetical protein
MTFDDFTAELFKDSFTCRLFRRPAKRWAYCLMATWDAPEECIGSPESVAAVQAMWKREWRQAARDKYREEYGNPMIWLYILSIVLQLIWKWWLSRNDAVEMAALCTEATQCVARHRNRGG